MLKQLKTQTFFYNHNFVFFVIAERKVVSFSPGFISKGEFREKTKQKKPTFSNLESFVTINNIYIYLYITKIETIIEKNKF
jgi:hypothetical protein